MKDASRANDAVGEPHEGVVCHSLAQNSPSAPSVQMEQSHPPFLLLWTGRVGSHSELPDLDLQHGTRGQVLLGLELCDLSLVGSGLDLGGFVVTLEDSVGDARVSSVGWLCGSPV